MLTFNIDVADNEEDDKHPDISHIPNDQPIPAENPNKSPNPIPVEEPNRPSSPRPKEAPIKEPNSNPGVRVLNVAL